MLTLSLTWLALGLIIGALALLARLRPPSWHRYGYPALLLLGMFAALAGGWLGAWLLGTESATGMALWVAVVAVIAPRAAKRFGKRGMTDTRERTTR